MDLIEFLNKIFLKNGKYNVSQATKHWFEVRNYLKFYNEILKLTSYYDEFEKLYQRSFLYLRIKDVLNNTLFKRKCPICNKDLIIIKNNWQTTCRK